MNPQVIDELFGSSDVSAGRSEALRERSHQNVDVFWVHLVVVDNPATSWTHSTDLTKFQSSVLTIPEVLMIDLYIGKIN